jgi:phospholipase C
MLTRVEYRFAKHRLRRRDDERDMAKLPDPTQPPGTDLLPKIDHIVILMMENHSFDNYLGLLGRGEGFTLDGSGQPLASNPDANHVPVKAHRLPTRQHIGVPTQSWHASHIQFNGGANDGFVRSIEQTVPGKDATVAMGYWTEEDLPFYAGLAGTFPLADRWFCSLLGPTFPNRRFLMAATAHGLIDDVAIGMIDYPSTGLIFDLLDRNGISWVNYHHTKTSVAILKRAFGVAGLLTARGLGLLASNAFPSILKQGTDNLQFTADIYPVGFFRCAGHMRSINSFWTDAAAGTLPSVSIVDPDFQNCSEENPGDVRTGEGFAAQVINAVMHGPAWSKTLLVWTYDEHGGYYDHVPPPKAVEPDAVLPRSILLDAGGPIRWLLKALGVRKELEAIDSGAGRYDNYGYRVPAVVVSPYARRECVSETTYDHTSILKLIEHKWNLPPLTSRDHEAKAPLDMLDFDTPAFLEPPILPAPAVPWPTPTVPTSKRVAAAQAVGIVRPATFIPGTNVPNEDR